MSLSPPDEDTLNPEQIQAIHTTEGPVLVLAGAGTGKTRVLTTRLSYILSSKNVYPSQILAVTFTNKAANEMRERVTKMAGQAAIEGIWLGTFHSLALRIVRRYAERLGIRADFTILDSEDQKRLIKQILTDQGIDEKKNTTRLVASVINRWKDRGLTPEKVTKAEAGRNPLFLNVYQDYQQRLLILNAVDFGDLLLHSLTLFTDFPDVIEGYQKQFKYIMVDEYQDTNIAQYLWLRLLAMHNHNICCVGDDDQSIYAWRGAEVGNILRFDQDFPHAVIIRLEQNYRSTPHILGAASGLIDHNTSRLGKKLWTTDDSDEKVLVRSTWDSDEEARFIGEKIEDYHRGGESFSQMAILVRAGFQTREFEDRLLVLGIPYRVVGGQKFYERQEIRDALSYFRLVAQPDDGLAFERIINSPRRGIGQSTLQLIHKTARSLGCSLPKAALDLCESPLLRGNVRTALRSFFDAVHQWRDVLASSPNHAEVTEMILEESGYLQMWQEDKSPDSGGRLENLNELISAIREFDSLQAFLEHVSLVMDNTRHSHEQMVSLMTLHASKGLEFNVVFLPGWEEGLLPHPRSLDESGLEGLEEERRLAYVGITRAKKKAIISYAGNRKSYQGWQSVIPSRFIKELPPAHIEHIQANGVPSSPVSKNDSWSFRSLWKKKPPSERRSSVTPFSIGETVFHQKFGYGVIENVEGAHLTIYFDTSGTKTIIADFIEKTG